MRLNTAAFTVREAGFVAVASEAVIVAEPLETTGIVAMLNCNPTAPSGTVTDAGTVANALLELKLMTQPPAGALPVNFNLPKELPPPVTVVGVSAKEE